MAGEQLIPGTGAAFFEALAERVSDLVCLHEPDGRFRRISTRAWDILGYTSSELVRWYPRTLIHPDDDVAARVWEEFCNAAAGAERVTPPCRLLTRSGATVDAVTRLVPFLDAHGEVESFVSITRAESQPAEGRDDALHWREYLYALDQHAMVTIADGQDRILYVNERFCAATGWDRTGLIGQTHALFSAGVLPESYFEAMENAVTQGEVWQGEMATRKADGDHLWTWMTVVPFVADRGRDERYIAIRTDLTEVKQSERQLQVIGEALDAAPVGVTIADAHAPDCPLTYVNDALCAMTGYQRDEMIGRNCRFLQQGDREQDGVRHIREAIAEGRPVTTELRNYRKDGSFFWNSFTLAPVRDGSGVTTHFIGIQTDITAHRQLLDRLDASERRIRLMTSRVSGAVFHFRSRADGQWELPFMSEGFQRLSGVPAEEAMADVNVVLDAIHHDDRERMREAILAAEREGVTFREEARMQPLGGGQARWCFIEATPDRDEDGGWSWYGQMVDITDQKRAQDELEKARVAAEQASRVKSQFLANMSHELRTPLNAIVGMSELLQETRLDGEQRRYLEVFRTASSNLLEIINNLLDLSKIEAGHLSLEEHPFDLEDLLERQLDLLAARAREKGLDLVLHVAPGTPCQVFGDPARVRQVLTNLVGNAVKFTEWGGVTVSVAASPDDPERLVFSIRDTGIGIPEDKRAEIFEAFTQADSGITRQYGGTGLGLTICRQLVRLMSGDVGVECPPDGGTVFTFDLPLLRGVEGSTCPLAGWSLPGSGEKVLVVDDFADGRHALRAMLAPWVEVHEADHLSQVTDDEAQSPSGDADYRVAFIDAHLPQLHAEPAQTWLGRLVRTTRVVLVCNEERAAQRLQQAGLAHTCLSRPLKRRDVTAQLRAALEGPEFDEDDAAREAETDQRPVPDRVAEPARLVKRCDEPLHVIVAEDDATNALLIRTLLQQAECRVEVVDNGEDAVERARETPPDLILMDLQMPRMGGEEATRRIRAEEGAGGRPRVPIVALSAHALEEYRQRSFEAGCDDYLTKPLHRRALHALLERIRTTAL